MILEPLKYLLMANKIKHNKIAIIIPAYNEHQNIQRLINQINYYLDQPNIFVMTQQILKHII